MRGIETSLTTLWSPLWPADFPSIDTVMQAMKGGRLFEKASCNVRHLDIKRDDPNRHVKAVMRAVGTEDLMFVNFEKRRGDTGKLKRRASKKVVRSAILGSAKFGPIADGEEACFLTWSSAPSSARHSGHRKTS